jgi:hypothetical protein
MIEVNGSNVTVRRCFAYGTEWLGRDFCGAAWPWIDGVQVYNASNNLIENVIAMGPYPVWALSVQANDPKATAANNRVLGSAAIGAGYDLSGTLHDYNTLPQPNTCMRAPAVQYSGHMVGFMLWGQGAITNNTMRDLLLVDNAGLGFTNMQPMPRVADVGNVLDHATIYGNGEHATADEHYLWGYNANLGGITPTNSRIEGTQYQGEGARLTKRYIDGVLTDAPLWPWPMETRGHTELGLSITGLVAPYLEAQ